MAFPESEDELRGELAVMSGKARGNSEISSTVYSSERTKSPPRPVRCSSYQAFAASTSAAASDRKRTSTLRRPLQAIPYLFPRQVPRIRLGETLLDLLDMPFRHWHLIRAGRDRIPRVTQELDSLLGW